MAHLSADQRALQRFDIRSADALLEILDHSHVGLWEWNLHTGENLITSAWAAQLGYTLEGLSPLTFNTFIELIHVQDQSHVEAAVQACLAGQTKTYAATFRMLRRDQSWVWVEACGQVTAWTDDGAPLLMSGTHIDITSLKAMEDELRNSSITDALTGWYNHTHFLQAGSVTVSRALRQQHRLALFIFTIDHLKSITHRYGHALGDQLVQTVTALVTERLRSIDIAGRIDGGKFAIILDGAALGDARTIAEKLRQSIEALDFRHTDTPIPQVTASFGVTMIDDQSDSIESMLERAATALYKAKANGRNRTELA